MVKRFTSNVNRIFNLFGVFCVPSISFRLKLSIFSLEYAENKQQQKKKKNVHRRNFSPFNHKLKPANDRSFHRETRNMTKKKL